MAVLLLFAMKAGAQSRLPRRSPVAASPPTQLRPRSVRPTGRPRRFFDRTNLALFTGVAAVRVLDFTSTEHFRERGHNEVLLTNSIVDNKPLFAGIEAAGFVASVAVSYWLFRKGHYRLQRWVSIIHIVSAGAGDARNYSLSAPKAAVP